jgi:hypothetical protein
MKRKTSNDEISVLVILQNLWKDKLLLLITSLLFSCVFGLSTYYYKSYHEINKPRLVKTELILKSDNEEIKSHFEKPFIFYNQVIDLTNFKFDLNSSANVLYFFQQNNNKFRDFEVYLEQSNISAKDYFSMNFKSTNGKYSLQYPEQLNGELFLKEYLIFLFKQLQLDFINNVKTKMLSDILNFENNIELLNKIDTNKNITRGDKNYIIQDHNHNFNKFSADRDIINLRISILKEFLVRVDTFVFDFEPIIELKSSKARIKSPKNFALIGLMFGFFLALIFVFFKNLIKKD